MLDTPTEDIDKEFCHDFIQRLRNSPLSGNTKHQYQTMFSAILSFSQREGDIPTNPMRELSSSEKLKPHSPSKAFLTKDEIEKMASTPAEGAVKRAFLFSCFTGLRLSDIRALEWKNIQEGNIRLRMKKTGQEILIPLSIEARKCLPPKEGGKVFPNLGANTTAKVTRWASRSGILKKVTFHTARHSFATLLLTFGADIYTVSRLLGHSDLKTTQIYAHLVDSKKSEAVKLLDKAFR